MQKKYQHAAAQLVSHGPLVLQRHIQGVCGFSSFWTELLLYFFIFILFKTAKITASLHFIRDMFDQAQTSIDARHAFINFDIDLPYRLWASI